MNLKKILLLGLTVFLLTSSLGTFASEERVLTELINNPGFEDVSDDGTPKEVYLGNGEWGTNFSLEKARPYAGQHSLKILGGTKVTYASWGSNKLLDNTDMTFSFYIKCISAASTGVRVSTEFYSEDKVSATAYMEDAKENVYITDLREGRWMLQTVTLHIPKGAKRAGVMISLSGGGEIYIDNVSWMGLCDPELLKADEEKDNMQETQPIVILPPKEGMGEMVLNGGFEDAETDGSVINWGCNGNAERKWPGNLWVNRTQDAYSGDYALKLTCNGSATAWAVQGVNTELVPGARYQISCRLKMDGLPGKGFTFKMEPYKDPALGVENALPDDLSIFTESYSMSTSGEWQQYVATFISKENVPYVGLYPMVRGGGSVIVDDISMYMVNDEVSGDLYCEEVFTYSDREGTVSAWMDLYLDKYPELSEATAEFVITREGKTLFSKSAIPDETGRVSVEYSRLLLTEKKVPYLVTVRVKDKEGKEIATDSMNIYKYDRPTRIREDGVYLMNGKPFTPVFNFATDHTRLADIKASGINVVSISYWWTDVETDPSRLETILALLEQHDLYGLFALYTNMVPAGHPQRVNNTRLAVQRLKGHPRVFAYSLQDEPTQTVDLNQVEDLMAASYKLVRDIDPDIPVFCVDNSKYLDVNYRYADINCVDPYWQGNGSLTTYAQKMVAKMSEINEFDKPTYSLVSAFDWRGGFPTGDEIRHNIYQSLFAGAKGIGYYCLEGATTDDAGNKVNLMDTDRWPTVVKAHREEYPMLIEHFVYGETPMFNEAKDKDVWYRSWVKDDKIYMAALSQSDTNDVIVKLPLTSDTGVTVNKFAARVLAGGNVASIVREDGIIEYKLSAKQCVVFEIEPMEDVDFTSLFAPKFDDLYEHTWARMQIEALSKKNIVIGRAGADEQGYRPDEAITRADFAMYLVRAMGLASNIQVSFSDINANSYYAAELAAGKLDGVLQGVGENKFNPDGYITREDMMVMACRKLKLSGSGDLSAFTDGMQTSEYAVDSVSAMVEKGLIQGDGFGKLNPKGNATRAEAAIFINRLLEAGVI